MRTDKERGRVVGITAFVLGIGTLLIPSVVVEAVFFMPASFVCGFIAEKHGQRRLGGAAIVMGVIAIFDLLFLACLHR